ncbi:hypothetical protein BDR07DRAFT_1090291 [Suillus spraguei]|nr:hypothetical protein BDR07DRAFT_1090291 [Suillus spraguei]
MRSQRPRLQLSKKPLKDSRSHSSAPPNVHHDGGASSIPNIETQDVEVEDTRSAVQGAQQTAKCMLTLSGPATTAVSVGQDVQADLDTADTFQDTYLKPLRIFDDVIGKIADVHPYAKMALGVLSCAAKIILAQADRDEAVLELLKKTCEVYDFITQDDMLDQISSMHIILGKISRQTHECANFIKNYSDTKNFCES